MCVGGRTYRDGGERATNVSERRCTWSITTGETRGCPTERGS